MNKHILDFVAADDTSAQAKFLEFSAAFMKLAETTLQTPGAVSVLMLCKMATTVDGKRAEIVIDKSEVRKSFFKVS